ncbi:MAG: hypothetical protein ACRDE2_04945 [Chitinophagaceae bacterium]
MSFAVIETFPFYSCNYKQPYKLPYEASAGIVIGRENCFVDTMKNYWLVYLTVYPNTKQYGDTISLNGTTYTNVVKTNGLKSPFNQIGEKAGLSFTISAERIQTQGCNVSSPVTYKLKVLKVIAEGYVP